MTGSVIELPIRSDPAQFAKAKWAWLDMIAGDERISAAAFKLAYLLASRFLNRDRGYAYPPQKALGKLLGIRERQVRNLLSQLVDCGYIEVTHCGKQLPNEYRIATPKPGKVTGRKSAASSGTKSAGPYQPSEQPFEGARGDAPASSPSSRLPSSGQCSTLDGSSNPPDAALALEGSLASEANVLDEIDVDGLGRCLLVAEGDSRITVRSIDDGTEYPAERIPDGSYAYNRHELDDEIPV